MTHQTPITQLFSAQSSFKRDWAKLNLFDISRKPSMDFAMGTPFTLENDQQDAQNAQFPILSTDESDPFSSDVNDSSSFIQNSSSLMAGSEQDQVQQDCFKAVNGAEYFENVLKSEQFAVEFPDFPEASIPNFDFPSQQENNKKLRKTDILDVTQQLTIKQESNQSLQQSKKQKNIFSIQKKKIEKKSVKKAKNYDKNICRYLTRRTIRCFANLEYFEKVIQICNGDQTLYSEATEYFTRRIERITGFRVLKEFLDVIGEPDPKIKQIKQVFKEFYKWFLQERIVRYIMKGEMVDKLMYIKYKNEVMLQYVDTLQDWKSNKNTTKIAKKKFF